MIQRLLEKFSAGTKTPEPEDTALAAAVLLTEVIKADYAVDDTEKSAMKKAMTALIPERDAEVLLTEAFSTSDTANDLQKFTSIVHKHWSDEQKSDLLVGMWRVAFADEKLDKYEEHIIRRIADLLYIPHSEFIRTKLIARDH